MRSNPCSNRLSQQLSRSNWVLYLVVALGCCAPTALSYRLSRELSHHNLFLRKASRELSHVSLVHLYQIILSCGMHIILFRIATVVKDAPRALNSINLGRYTELQCFKA